MNFTLNKLNNKVNSNFNFDKYFFDNSLDSKNSLNNFNSNYNNQNFIKNNNNFINTNLNNKSLDILEYKNYFSNYNYNQSISFNKIYMPKPFNASQSNIYNGLP
jgi:hypothetical protein